MTDDAVRSAPPRAGRIVGNAAISGVQQVVSIAVGMLLLPYMLARMGPERYGSLLVVQILSMSGLVAYADLGLTAAAMRYLAADYVQGRVNDFRELLATTFAAFVAIGTVSGLLVLAFAELLFARVFTIPAVYERETRLALYLYAGTLPIQFAIVGLRAFYAAVQDVMTLKIWELVSRLAYAAAIVLLLLRRQDILGIVLAEQLVAAAFFAAFVCIAARRYRGYFTLHLGNASKRSLTRMVSLGWRAYANHLSSYFVYQKAPDVFIAHYLGPVAVTHFAIISRIPRALKTLTAAANSAVAPAAAALEGLELPGKMRQLVLLGARYSYLLLTPLVAFLLVFAGDLLRLWVGAEYVFLADPMRAFLLWYYLAFVVHYTNATLTREEQYRRLLAYGIVGNVVFLGLMAIGIEGLALWAVLGALFAGLLIMIVGSLRVQAVTRGLSFKAFYGSVVRLPVAYSGAGALAASVLLRMWLRPNSLIELAALLTGLYALHAVLVVRFGLERAERQQLGGLLRRAQRA